MNIWKPALWEPQAMEPYNFKIAWKTTVTTFESGKEQRRKKWSANRRTFTLNYNHLTETIERDIRNFFDARYGAYTTFYFPNYAEQIKGTRLACVENAPAEDTITDSSLEFGNFKFEDCAYVCISGSGVGNDTGSVESNGYYEIDSVPDIGTIKLKAAEDLVVESANADLIVYKVFTVRFVEDTFENSFIKPSTGASKTIDLIEVL